MNASVNETVRVKTTIIATSPKNSPTLPSKKKNVENATRVVRIAAVIAGITSNVPSMAALMGGDTEQTYHLKIREAAQYSSTWITPGTAFRELSTRGFSGNLPGRGMVTSPGNSG